MHHHDGSLNRQATSNSSWHWTSWKNLRQDIYVLLERTVAALKAPVVAEPDEVWPSSSELCHPVSDLLHQCIVLRQTRHDIVRSIHQTPPIMLRQCIEVLSNN